MPALLPICCRNLSKHFISDSSKGVAVQINNPCTALGPEPGVATAASLALSNLTVYHLTLPPAKISGLENEASGLEGKWALCFSLLEAVTY